MLAAVSCHYEGTVNSVLVFASGRPISIEALSFINALSKNVGLSVNNALSYETIKKTTEELNSERNKLNAVMYNMVDGLLVTDTDGCGHQGQQGVPGNVRLRQRKHGGQGSQQGLLARPAGPDRGGQEKRETKSRQHGDSRLPDGRTAKALATSLTQETLWRMSVPAWSS